MCVCVLFYSSRAYEQASSVCKVGVYTVTRRAEINYTLIVVLTYYYCFSRTCKLWTRQPPSCKEPAPNIMRVGTLIQQDRCLSRQQSEWGGRGVGVAAGLMVKFSLSLFLFLSLSLSPSPSPQTDGGIKPISECRVLLSNGRDPWDWREVQRLGKGCSLCSQHVLKSKGVSDVWWCVGVSNNYYCMYVDTIHV